MKKLLLCTIAMLLSLASFPQDNLQKTDTLRKDALNVFMDATDYIRKEIPYINYVRDIRDAGVYIISTRQTTGSGGQKFTFFLVGQHQFSGMRDTISFTTMPGETQDQVRAKEVSTLKMGLVRYVAKTPLAKFMSISFTEPLSETVTSDKWNSWVFSTSMNGFLDGEKSYKESYLYGNLSASRVTRDWKINLNGRLNFILSKYDLDTAIITSRSNSKSINTLIVRSISDHWSYGGSMTLQAASYNNLDFSLTAMPGIEYALYPYSQSTRKQLRLLYSLGYTFSNYTDSTIYDKVAENHLRHSFNAAYEVVQKWGTIDISFQYSNYFHDWSKNNFSLNGFVDLRIAKGLNLNFGGSAALIHDQLGLVKGGATTEEVLLRRKELATQFQYFTSFGLTFTFGSIYNNVVNPRFGNSGGGGMTIIMN
jgi:hypothetical protein